MKQITVKRAVEALHWLHNNEHHIVGTENSKIGADGKLTFSHVYYQNYHEKLRVPYALCQEVGKYIRPNKRKFDTRMYALTPKGRQLVER